MKKKFISLLMASCMTATLLTGCGSSSTNTVKKDASGKVALTAVVLKHPLTKKMAKIKWLKNIADKAGISVKYEEISADWDQKKGALLSSGDIPDLLIGAGGLTDADFVTYKGLFEDMSQYINEKDTPNIYKMFKDNPELKAISTQSDGKIYSLPKYQQYWPCTATRQFINKQWLKNLGLKEPTTLDELYNVLLAFKEKDANGNGDPNDEIPMDWGPGFGYYHATNMLGGAGITLSEGSFYGYFAEDGKIKNFFTDDRYKELVSFLHKCYKAGLINKEVFTQDYTTYQSVARGKGDTGKVGFSFGWERSDRFGNKLKDQYEVLAPVKFSADQKENVSWSYDYNSLNYSGNMISLSSKCSDKKAAMKFIDSFYQPETSVQVLFGDEGTCVKKESDTEYSVLAPTDKNTDPGTWKWTNSLADDGPLYLPKSIKVNLGTDMASNAKDTKVFDDVFANVDLTKNVVPFVFLKYSEEDNSKLSLTNTNITNVCQAQFATWVAEGGVEKGWDSYLKKAKETGIEDGIAITQKYYDKYIKANH